MHFRMRMGEHADFQLFIAEHHPCYCERMAKVRKITYLLKASAIKIFTHGSSNLAKQLRYRFLHPLLNWQLSGLRPIAPLEYLTGLVVWKGKYNFVPITTLSTHNRLYDMSVIV